MATQPLWHSTVIEPLRRGGAGVLPTDTIYGIVGSALYPKTVQRIYRLRHRNPVKPMIILIGDTKDLKKFGILLSPQIKIILKRIWPGKVSVILPIASRSKFLTKFKYLHRGTGTLAFRLPADEKVGSRSLHLQALLRQTGPLVAPSANFEGKTPARTIDEAKKYFGDRVEFYVDIGKMNSKSSTLVKIEEGKPVVLRKGAGAIW